MKIIVWWGEGSPQREERYERVSALGSCKPLLQDHAESLLVGRSWAVGEAFLKHDLGQMLLERRLGRCILRGYRIDFGLDGVLIDLHTHALGTFL